LLLVQFWDAPKTTSVLTVGAAAPLFTVMPPLLTVIAIPAPPLMVAALPLLRNVRLLIVVLTPSEVTRLPATGVDVLKNTSVVGPGICCVSMLPVALVRQLVVSP